MNAYPKFCLECGAVDDHFTTDCPLVERHEDEFVTANLHKYHHEIETRTIEGTGNQETGTAVQGEGEGKD